MTYYLPPLPPRTPYGVEVMPPMQIPDFRRFPKKRGLNNTAPTKSSPAKSSPDKTSPTPIPSDKASTAPIPSPKIPNGNISFKIKTRHGVIPSLVAIPVAPPANQIEYPIPSTLPESVVQQTLMRPLEENVLFVSLRRLLAPYISEQILAETFKEYHVGTSYKAGMRGAPIFYQMDEMGGIRTGKMMSYDDTAHRNGKLKWIHRLLPEADTYHLQQCFFGTHLYPDILSKMTHHDEDVVILLVESEKTALILRALYRENGFERFVPMATGGSEGFNPKEEHLANPHHALQALRNRKVTLYPDNGKFEIWDTRSTHLQSTCQIFTNDIMECPDYLQYKCPGYTLRKGDDISDLILECVRRRINPLTLLPSDL